MPLISVSRRKENLFYILFAVFYFWLAAQIPYTHDDWDWGLDIGMHQFLYATVNSRYAGNFFEIVMTRSELLKVVIMGSVYFLLPYLLTRLAAKNLHDNSDNFRVTIFLLCNALLLSMHRMLWGETYGWVAGFANFCISAMFLMPWIDALLNIAEEHLQIKQDSYFVLLFYFLTSVCGQLFLENVAIYCVLLGVILCVIYYLKCKKIPLRTITMLLGAVVGLIIMFSGSLYDTLLTTGNAVEGYRQIPMLSGNGIFHTFKTMIRTAVLLGIRLYSMNMLPVVILGIFIWYLSRKSGNIKNITQKSLLFINIILIAAFSLGALYDWQNIGKPHAVFMYCVDFAASIGFFLVILIEVFLLFCRKLRKKLVGLWVSVPLVIAPLIVTTEVGYRLFFTTNIFMTLFVLILVCDLLGKASSYQRTILKRLCFLAIAVILGIYGVVYANIGQCKRMREQIIADAIEQKASQIVLPAYPFDGFMHYPDPSSDSRMDFFLEFYGIPSDIELIFEERER